MRAFERKNVPRFDSVVAVSQEDREQMSSEYGVDAVFEVPTGVDTNFFRPAGIKNFTAQPRVHGFNGLAAE
jgi:glycosyltransferase involved in cell wall biosynthesis